MQIAAKQDKQGLTRPFITVAIVALAAAAIFAGVQVFGERVYFKLPVPAYLALHNILEFASVVISFAVFVINWIAYGQNKSRYSLVIAGGFLAVGLLDLMHLLSFNGMPDFITPSSPEKAIDYWVSARFWDALTLLVSAFILYSNRSRLINRASVLLVNLGVAGAVFVLVSFFQEVIPHTFLPSSGLTPLKVFIEYCIVAVLLVAIGGYIAMFRQQSRNLPTLILCALVISVFGELVFTLYVNVYDSLNLLGHLYKIAAYVLIFRALLVSSVVRPYADLQQANDELRAANENTHRKAKELGILNQVASTVNRSLDLDQVLHDTVSKVLQLVNVEAGMVLLADERTKVLRPAVSQGIPLEVANEYESRSLKIGEGLAGMAALSDVPIVGGSLSEDPRGKIASIRPLGLRAFAFVPIQVHDQQLGTMLVATHGDREFSPEEVQLLSNIAGQVGMAVYNAVLFGKTDEQLQIKVAELADAERRAHFLSDVSVLLNENLDLPNTLNQLGKAVTAELADFAVILLKEADGSLSGPLVRHVDERKQRIAEAEFSERPFMLGEGIVGRVAATGKPVFRRQISADEFATLASPGRLGFYSGMGFKSHIAVPLRVGANLIGAMAISITESERQFSDNDFELAQEIAHRAAMAIENSRLYQRVSQERQRLQSIIDQLPEGVVITAAPLGSFVLANQVAHSMGGHLWVGHQPVEDPAARGVCLCTPEGGVCCVEDLPAYRALYNKEHILGEQLVVNRNGDQVTVLVNASPVLDGNGNVTGAVVIFQDITEIKNLERAKDEFISIASHDIKSPVTSIKGYAQLAQRRLIREDFSNLGQHLEAIDKQADYVARLVDTLLDVSRIQLGGLRLKQEPVDLLWMVKEAVENIKVSAPEHQFEVLTEGECRQGQWDRGRLTQVVANLIGNAVKYSGPGSKVTVNVSFDEQWAQLSVEDEGIGIPEAELPHVFDRFYRTSNAAKSEVRGTGLGLYISKAIVLAHGGEIGVESTQGLGSKFSFRIPYEGQGSGVKGQGENV